MSEKINKENHKIYHDYIGLVRNIAKKYKQPSIDYKDMEQVGILGLMRSKEVFNSKKSKFSTYAYYWIRKYILEFIGTIKGKKDINAKYKRLDIDMFNGTHDNSITYFLTHKDNDKSWQDFALYNNTENFKQKDNVNYIEQLLDKAIVQMTKVEKKVFVHRVKYGKTFQEIGKLMKMNTESVRKSYINIVDILHHTAKNMKNINNSVIIGCFSIDIYLMFVLILISEIIINQ